MRAVIRRWASQPMVWLRRNGGFEGDYSSWQEAEQVAGGYDAPAIFERVRDAALKVKQGEAVFERDSVCFYHEEYRWPTLACLLRIAAENGGRLHVIDFGGSLGSFWFQHRRHLMGLKEVCWTVVEQPHFVACGREEFQDENLKFSASLEEAVEARPADVIFCSSVLEYLSDPYAWLQRFAKSDIRWLLLDRTPFIEANEDRLTVQKVPPSIYPASYPAWFFSRQKFNKAVRQFGYVERARFTAEDDVGIGCFEGVLLERA